MFRDSEFTRQVDEECQRIREADREAARRGELAERCSLTFCRSMRLRPGNLTITARPPLTPPRPPGRPSAPRPRGRGEKPPRGCPTRPGCPTNETPSSIRRFASRRGLNAAAPVHPDDAGAIAAGPTGELEAARGPLRGLALAIEPGGPPDARPSTHRRIAPPGRRQTPVQRNEILEPPLNRFRSPETPSSTSRPAARRPPRHRHLKTGVSFGGPLRIHVRRGPRRPAHHGPAKLPIAIDLAEMHQHGSRDPGPSRGRAPAGWPRRGPPRPSSTTRGGSSTSSGFARDGPRAGSPDPGGWPHSGPRGAHPRRPLAQHFRFGPLDADGHHGRPDEADELRNVAHRLRRPATASRRAVCSNLVLSQPCETRHVEHQPVGGQLAAPGRWWRPWRRVPWTHAGLRTRPRRYAPAFWSISPMPRWAKAASRRMRRRPPRVGWGQASLRVPPRVAVPSMPSSSLIPPIVIAA